MHGQLDIKNGVTSPAKFKSVFIIVYLHFHDQIFITRTCAEGRKVTNLQFSHALYLRLFCDSLKKEDGLFACAMLTGRSL